MKKMVASFLAVLSLALILVVPAFAQNHTTNQNDMNTNNMNTNTVNTNNMNANRYNANATAGNNNRTDWGWLGLLGLAGLIGLRGRNPERQ
ncbi:MULTISPECIES: WGxxGxxG family protein [Paenibacillus]|uniref:MYXO-CTERM domain-containing protein n=1 Tax=Paenibacillus campinasensis TaxID=66347 RepID=A0A268EPE5_9BACL|nr:MULTISPECIES: WGxxGxxG family protein [Paenibacillus]MUG66164.1 hypothetical protein [Paenibacillus campinasensis]PAD74994.1 hypothetical protein CHH67_17100 [Paenibacillus campinasensis]PAK50172.1 hypothetical protein CHH75_18665 [Paenibacillus sp. 7541]